MSTNKVVLFGPSVQTQKFPVLSLPHYHQSLFTIYPGETLRVVFKQQFNGSSDVMSSSLLFVTRTGGSIEYCSKTKI